MNGNFTPRLEENKKRVMESSIFGGNDSQPTYNSPSKNLASLPIQQPRYSQEQHYYKQQDVQQYRSPQKNLENIPPSNYSIANPPCTSFSTPSFTGLVHSVNVPALSAFPEINLTPIQGNDSYDFSLKPRTALRPPQKTLAFKPNNQMKMLRDTLSHDMTSFQQRIQRLNVNTPITIKMATFDHKEVPRSAEKPQRQPLIPPKKTSSPTKSSQLKSPPKQINDNHDTTSLMNTSSTFNTSLNSSVNTPGFSTHSEFIMPDGSSFD